MQNDYINRIRDVVRRTRPIPGANASMSQSINDLD